MGRTLVLIDVRLVNCMPQFVGYYEASAGSAALFQMSGLTLPVDRGSGRAIVIGTASCRALCDGILARLGYQVVDADDPYLAMAEICQRPLAYRAAALSLASVYREELSFIGAIKRRFPHMEIWLAHTDGRPAALAEASRLGADGLLSEDGLHRFAVGGSGGALADEVVAQADVDEVAGGTPGHRAPHTALSPEYRDERMKAREYGREEQSPQEMAAPLQPAVVAQSAAEAAELGANEPLLTAEELKALLEEQPVQMPEEHQA